MAAAFLCVTTPATAQEGDNSQNSAEQIERLALARQIVETGYPPAAREQLYFGTVDQVTAQMREASLSQLPADPGAEKILDAWLSDWIDQGKSILRQHIPALMDGLAQGYANIFTTRELNDILAFVRTSSGQRFLLGSTAVIADPAFAGANQKYMNEVMARLPSAQEELRKELEAYFAEKQRDSIAS